MGFFFFSVGFSLSNKVLNAVAMRFNNKSGRISFDDFLQIMARLNTLFSKPPCLLASLML